MILLICIHRIWINEKKIRNIINMWVSNFNMFSFPKTCMYGFRIAGGEIYASTPNSPSNFDSFIFVPGVWIWNEYTVPVLPIFVLLSLLFFSAGVWSWTRGVSVSSGPLHARSPKPNMCELPSPAFISFASFPRGTWHHVAQQIVTATFILQFPSSFKFRM